MRAGSLRRFLIQGMISIGLTSMLLVFAATFSVGAMSFSSSNYVIDTAVLNNTGGFSSSANYKLESSGGEAAIGNGASGSYKLAAGYIAQIIEPTLTVVTNPSGLLAEYSFDEGSGNTTYDNSVYANTGYSTGTPSWVTGKLGQSLSLNGSRVVNASNASHIQVSTLSIEAWVKTSTSQNASVVGKNNAWALRLTTSGAALYNYNTNRRECGTTTNLSDGNWHHLTATIQSGVSNGTKLYIDGIESASCTLTIYNQLSYPSIGGVSGTAQFNGTIDEVKIFNRVLTASEVSADYIAQNSGVPSGLTLRTLLPGASNTSNFTVTVLATGSSYSLAMHQDHDLQSGSNTISAMSGSIADPASWSEGSTKGLGFTLLDTNATAIPAKWNDGDDYAALPNSATTFYARSGTQSTKDTLEMQLRADVTEEQPFGSYSNTMTISGTVSP